MAFHPYLFFSNGACREAFERYQQISSGERLSYRRAEENRRQPPAVTPSTSSATPA